MIDGIGGGLAFDSSPTGMLLYSTKEVFPIAAYCVKLTYLLSLSLFTLLLLLALRS